MAFRKWGLVVGAVSVLVISIPARAQTEPINNPGAINPAATNIAPGGALPPSATPDVSQEPPPGSDAKAYVAFGVYNATHTGNLDAAIAAFNQAIKLDPKYVPAYFNRGFAYSLGGDADAAISDFNQVVSLAPNLRDAYYQRGSAFGRKGDFAAASKDFQQAIKIDPNFANGHYNHGHVLYLQGDLNGALTEMNEAIRLDPSSPFSPQYYFIRGLVRRAQGHPEDAIGDFSKSLGLGDPMGALWVWVCQIEGGQKDAAKKDLTTALTRADRFQPTNWATGLAQLALGQVKEDRMVLTAQTNFGNSAVCQAWFYSGMAHRAAGDENGARACFNKAVGTGDRSSIEFVEASRILSGQHP